MKTTALRVLTFSCSAWAPALGVAEPGWQPEVSACSPFPPASLPHLPPCPGSSPSPGSMGTKPTMPRRGSGCCVSPAQTVNARESQDPQAEVSCKTNSALVGQRCCFGVAHPCLLASSCGRIPWKTSCLMCFTHHTVGKCSHQGSAEFTDTKPKQKMRATTSYAAEIPAAPLQRAASLRSVPRPRGNGSPREAAGCQVCRRLL